jgi:hypothetical protein
MFLEKKYLVIVACPRFFGFLVLWSKVKFFIQKKIKKNE